MVSLIITRHGESQANRDNIFTGWSDVNLTPKGYQQAHDAGRLIQRTGLEFTAVHTSMLKRAIITANIILEETDQLWLPEFKSWRLNERHYGALRGQNKKLVAQKVGDKQVKIWRRSFDAVPPLLAVADYDKRYSHLGVKIPRGESLKMAQKRLLPYWQDQIAPRLLDGQNQLIVAHGSTMRALIKYLEKISDSDISSLEVPNGEPIQYEFDSKLNIIKKTFLQY